MKTFAAMMVPLFVRGSSHHLLFTRRPKTLRHHAGQISFPGGGRESHDETPLHTALRETQEELGIPPDRVELLGILDEIPTIIILLHDNHALGFRSFA